MRTGTALSKLLMRAIRVKEFGGPEVLQVEHNLEKPVATDGEVLVSVKCAGVNPVDTYIRQGTYAGRTQALPYTPGTDAAGVVENIGSKVTKFKIGDRVFGPRSTRTGSYGEYAVYSEASVYPLPSHLSFSEGAAVGVPYFTAYRALMKKANAKPGCSVLVHGASGAVGLAVVQIAKSQGMRVFGTAGTPDGLKLVEENGAIRAFNHRESTDYFQEIISASGGGVDVVIEMLSNVNLGRDLELLNMNGRVVVVGCRGTVDINPRLLMQKEGSITGVALATASQDDWNEMAAFILGGLNQKWLKPVVYRKYPLESAAQAHKDIINASEGAKGNIVLSLE